MRSTNADLLEGVRKDLHALAGALHSGEPSPAPAIRSLPRYANEEGWALFGPDLRRIVDEELPDDLRRPARAIFAISQPGDAALDFSRDVPALTSRERAIADNGTARRWMRQAVLTETATRLALLAAPSRLTRQDADHTTSFYVGRYAVHVDHEMTLTGERCSRMVLSFSLSPNDKSRCFDWQLPLGSPEEAATCTAADESGEVLPSAVVSDGARSILLVYFGESFEDQWRTMTASIDLRGDAERLRELSYSHETHPPHHYVAHVRLSAAFADAERARTVGYHKFPHAWSRPERETLAAGAPAVLEFTPFGDNDYWLRWD